MSGQTLAAGMAAAVAAACTAIVAARLVGPGQRRAPLVAWTIGFALFTVAALALLDGAARGWSAVPFRIYYLTGGVLVVAYLAIKKLLLMLPGRTVTRLVAATMLFLTFASAAAVLAARVDAGDLARAGATPPNGALVGLWPKVLAIALNSAGTVVLLGGSLLSARRRRDPRPLLVAAGVGIIALGSSATRLGSYTLFALAQAVGVTMILLGLVMRRRSPG